PLTGLVHGRVRLMPGGEHLDLAGGRELCAALFGLLVPPRERVDMVSRSARNSSPSATALLLSTAPSPANSLPGGRTLMVRRQEHGDVVAVGVGGDDVELPVAVE